MKLTREIEFDVPDEIWDFVIGELGLAETEKFIVELASKGVTKGLKLGYEVAMAMKAGIPIATVIPNLLDDFVQDTPNVSEEVKDVLVLETEKHIHRILGELKDE